MNNRTFAHSITSMSAAVRPPSTRLNPGARHRGEGCGEFAEDPLAHRRVDMEAEGDGDGVEEEEVDGKLPRREPMLAHVRPEGSRPCRPVVGDGDGLLESEGA